MQSFRRWRTDIATRGWHVWPIGWPACRLGWLAPHVRGTDFALVESLLESSRVFLHKSCCGIPWFPLTNRSSLAVFWLNPVENTNLENSWNLSVKTPKSMLVIHFNHLCKVYWRFVMNVNYRQQTPPHLGFYSSSIKGWITQDITLGQGINKTILLRRKGRLAFLGV